MINQSCVHHRNVVELCCAPRRWSLAWDWDEHAAWRFVCPFDGQKDDSYTGLTPMFVYRTAGGDRLSDEVCGTAAVYQLNRSLTTQSRPVRCARNTQVSQRLLDHTETVRWTCRQGCSRGYTQAYAVYLYLPWFMLVYTHLSYRIYAGIRLEMKIKPHHKLFNLFLCLKNVCSVIWDSVIDINYMKDWN